MDFVTSDTHAFHKNILRYCNRPFADEVEMTEVIADNINSVVSKSDRLFHLGDWSFGGKHNIKRFREMIVCENIVLILGNHDQHIEKSPEEQALFAEIYEYKRTFFNGQRVTMCHFAMRAWEKRHYGAWNFYGDAHGSLPDDPNALAFDVGVDTEWPGVHKRFFPYTMKEIREIMAHKDWKPIDHHTPRTNP